MLFCFATKGKPASDLPPTPMSCFSNASVLVVESRKDNHNQNLKRKNRTKIGSDSSQQQEGSTSHTVRNCTTAAAALGISDSSPDKSMGCGPWLTASSTKGYEMVSCCHFICTLRISMSREHTFAASTRILLAFPS